MSLPIASYFFSSSLNSWSTTLNLFAFYATWSVLVLSHSPVKLEILGTTAIRIIFWLVPSLLSLLFDTLLPSLSESIKHNGASALPPRDARRLSRLVALAVFNLGLETALHAAISLGLGTFLLKQPLLRTPTALPLPWQTIKHLAALLTAREVLTYYLHRYVLHSQQSGNKPPTGDVIPASASASARRQSRRVAALHDRYAHARKGGGGAAPFSLQLMTDHPVPFLLHRFVPLYLPVVALQLWGWGRARYHNSSSSSYSASNLLSSLFNSFPTSLSGSTATGNLHLLTFFLYVGLATIEETLAMSGYTVVPGVIMGGIARRSALHHACPDKGNYGCWGVLDWVHGTSLGQKGGGVLSDVAEEAEKHRVGERGGRAGRKAAFDLGGRVQDGIAGGLRRSSRKRNAGGGRSGRRSRNLNGRGYDDGDYEDY